MSNIFQKTVASISTLGVLASPVLADDAKKELENENTRGSAILALDPVTQKLVKREAGKITDTFTEDKTTRTITLAPKISAADFLAGGDVLDKAIAKSAANSELTVNITNVKTTNKKSIDTDGGYAIIGYSSEHEGILANVFKENFYNFGEGTIFSGDEHRFRSKETHITKSNADRFLTPLGSLTGSFLNVATGTASLKTAWNYAKYVKNWTADSNVFNVSSNSNSNSSSYSEGSWAESYSESNPNIWNENNNNNWNENNNNNWNENNNNNWNEQWQTQCQKNGGNQCQDQSSAIDLTKLNTDLASTGSDVRVKMLPARKAVTTSNGLTLRPTFG